MKKSKIVVAMVATACAVMVAQEPQRSRDDGYRSSYVPKSLPTSVEDVIKDDPAGRREAMLEQYGGEFTPEFLETLTAAANEQTATYGPLGRGGIKAPAGGAWTNVGPFR